MPLAISVSLIAQSRALHRYTVRHRIDYRLGLMNTQRSPWTKPGVIAVVAIAVVINLVVDWRLFRPTNWVLFIVVETIVLGGIIAWGLSRSNRP